MLQHDLVGIVADCPATQHHVYCREEACACCPNGCSLRVNRCSHDGADADFRTNQTRGVMAVLTHVLQMLMTTKATRTCCSSRWPCCSCVQR
jgi:hypothetical protein